MMLSDISVRRPVFAAVASIILCVVGFASFLSLPVRELPSVDPAQVSVGTSYPGASAEVIEDRITQLLEQQVAGIPGVDEVSSQSRDGRSNINVTFVAGRDLDLAASDVRDAVSRVINRLPEQADPPQVSKANSDSLPIIFLGMSSDTMNRLELSDYITRHVRERFSTIPGVASVNMAGAQSYTMRIWLDPTAMAARGITVDDVQTALNSQNIELPAGNLEGPVKDFTIRVARNYATPEDFARMPVAAGGVRAATTVGSAALGGASATAGAPQGVRPAVTSVGNTAGGYVVRLGDIAKIEEAADNLNRISMLNGVEQVGIAIVRQAQANDLEVAAGVREAVEQINRTLPKGTAINITVDMTKFTEEAIHEVWVTMGLSLVMVAMVNFLFLGTWRAAIIPTVVAPICILSTFIVLAALGYSINLLTLLALVLSIGLVVDDAIVVTENIQRRVDEGEPPAVAAQRGARQVFFAVVATTLVLVSVFAPLMFIPGNTGALFVELTVAIVAAIVFSALLALSLSPMLASKVLRTAQSEGVIARTIDGAMHRLRNSYQASLELLLKGRAPAFAAGGLVLALALGAAGLFLLLPRESTPPEDRSRVSVMINAPDGTGYQYLMTPFKQVIARMEALRQQGVLEKTVAMAPPPFGGGGNVGTVMGVVNNDYAGRIPTDQLAAQLNREFSNISSARVQASSFQSTAGGRGPGGVGISLVAMGSEYPEIAASLRPLVLAAEANPAFARVQLNYDPTSPRIRVEIDREKAAAVGVSPQAIGRALQTMFGSQRATTYIKGGQEYDVVLQVERALRENEQDLSRVYVRSSSGATVPLSSVVSTDMRGDSPNRPRIDRQRAVSLSAQLNPGFTMSDGVKFFEGEIAKMDKPIVYQWGGATKDFLETGSSVGVAFALALLLVFLVLAAQFESWIHPAVIMLTVPVAALGGLFGLLVAGSSVNLYSQIGLVILVGIAAKNGILIVEFANQLRDQGLAVREAVIESAALRLRPIIMTSISAAAGAVPLILWGGAGGESRKTIGVTIFFGAIFATLVTLFVVPVFYNMLARFTGSPMAMARRIEAFEEAEKTRLANAAE